MPGSRKDLEAAFLQARTAIRAMVAFQQAEETPVELQKAASKALQTLAAEAQRAKPPELRPGLIPAHGGYRDLKSYQNAEIIHDATVVFCGRFVDRRSRTVDQMVQAARSSKQNIAEGSAASGTSKKTELKLVNVARASLEELLIDYQDFLRQHNLPLWDKEHPKAKEVRQLAYAENRSYSTYRPYVEQQGSEVAANTLCSLIHQTNYLLNQLVRQLETAFLEEGGFTERLYRVRKQRRDG